MYARLTNRTKTLLFDYEFDGTPLARVSNFKYLGVTITEDLNWNMHINNICCSAERRLWSLRRKLKGASSEAKLAAYLTLVRPVLEYASVVWDSFRNYQIDRIERIQRRAARFILSKYRTTDSVTDMLKQLNLQRLEQRRKIARLKCIYSMHRNLFNFDVQQYIKPRSSRSLRSSHPDQITPIMARIDVFKYSFFPRPSKIGTLFLMK